MHRSFYITRGKRVIDFIAAATGLLVLAPVFLTVALLVKLTSAGPVFYRQQRVGRDGKIFQILKFRSMFEDADKRGLPLTTAGDPRITAVGRVLRRFKLDEFPQLWNVMKGEMSLVGPRPEVPRYVALYSPRQRRVLTVRPGITDPASIAYQEEEKLLGRHSDADRFYRDVVLPDKLNMNLEYLDCVSLGYDLALVLRTTSSIFVPKWTSKTS